MQNSEALCDVSEVKRENFLIARQELNSLSSSLPPHVRKNVVSRTLRGCAGISDVGH